MDTPIQVDLGRIAQDLQIRRVQVESVVQLLDEGNTVPFITRYRKERTGNLNEVAIREIQLRVGRLRELAERKETILKAIEAQGKLTEELAAAIRAADNPKRLEDLYLPFKPKKKTKASEAREKGLEPLALRIWNRDETLTDLQRRRRRSSSTPRRGSRPPRRCSKGVGHILAEAISELAAVRDAVRRVVWKTGKIVTTKAEIPEGEGLEYRDYFDYSEPIAPHPAAPRAGDQPGRQGRAAQGQARGARGPTSRRRCFGQLPLEGHPHADFFRAAAVDALDRLLLPSMEREVRRDLTEMAERHAVDVFARNLRSLLLQPPIPKQVVLAIDPGFRTGCKVAVLDGHGNLLEHGVIHPHPPQNRRSEAKVFLKDLVGKHQVGVVAIGNGTACRETEELVAEIIAGRDAPSARTPKPPPPPRPPPRPDAAAHGRRARRAEAERRSPGRRGRAAADASRRPRKPPAAESPAAEPRRDRETPVEAARADAGGRRRGDPAGPRREPADRGGPRRRADGPETPAETHAAESPAAPPTDDEDHADRAPPAPPPDDEPPSPSRRRPSRRRGTRRERPGRAAAPTPDAGGSRARRAEAPRRARRGRGTDRGRGRRHRRAAAEADRRARTRRAPRRLRAGATAATRRPRTAPGGRRPAADDHGQAGRGSRAGPRAAPAPAQAAAPRRPGRTRPTRCSRSSPT